ATHQNRALRRARHLRIADFLCRRRDLLWQGPAARHRRGDPRPALDGSAAPLNPISSNGEARVTDRSSHSLFRAAPPAVFEEERGMSPETTNPRRLPQETAALPWLTHRGPQMETIEIGGPDIIASRIALGTWAMGGWMWGGRDVR